ncbi:hypothetical protein B0T20DRAFT_444840 [Sordaria brevicollis]|uniref:Uncharacterized protein n=1 Tax=Sordaria brevicollis TaxID=83679 RepID=A0AAE0P3C1_SORBR|nr:hypothetical protein B0T20DRAFT_444840 [Sordaria brevicollis]
MAISERLLSVLRQAEFDDRVNGGVVVRIHSRHVSPHELKETLFSMFPKSKYTIQLRRDRYSITFPEFGKCDLDQVLLGRKSPGHHHHQQQQPKTVKPPMAASTSSPPRGIGAKPMVIIGPKATPQQPDSDAAPTNASKDTLTTLPSGAKRTQRAGILSWARCLLLQIAKCAHTLMNVIRP